MIVLDPQLEHDEDNTFLRQYFEASPQVFNQPRVMDLVRHYLANVSRVDWHLFEQRDRPAKHLLIPFQTIHEVQLHPIEADVYYDEDLNRFYYAYCQ